MGLKKEKGKRKKLSVLVSSEAIERCCAELYAFMNLWVRS